MSLRNLQLTGLFQGVSRQPHSIRLPGQTQTSVNSDLSIFNAGFSKRNGTHYINTLTYKDQVTNEIKNIDPSTIVHVHFYKRDEKEQYLILFLNFSPWISVVDLNGNKYEVDIQTIADTIYFMYFEHPNIQDHYKTLTIGDTTLIVNTEVQTKMSSDTNSNLLSSDTFLSMDKLLQNNSLDKTKIYLIYGSKASSINDNYYVKYDTELDKWIETANPKIQNSLENGRMPHKLTRVTTTTNGKTEIKFVLKQINWKPRKTGDNIIVPEPGFIKHYITDIAFYRNRLALLSEETVYLSQAGDFYNFWPSKANQVLDSDPVSLTAGQESVEKLLYIIPFKKNLFTTSASNQFEVTSGNELVLSPKSGVINNTASIVSSKYAKPITFGTHMYLTSDNNKYTSVYRYDYQDEYTSHITDISKHITNWLPTKIYKLTSDTTSGTVFFLTRQDKKSIYIYKVFEQNNELVQSAWSVWNFDHDILDIEFIHNNLYFVINFNEKTVLEKIILEDDINTYEPYSVKLDHKYTSLGTLDSTTNKRKPTYNDHDNTTSWDLPYDINKPIHVVLKKKSSDIADYKPQFPYIPDDITKLCDESYDVPVDNSNDNIDETCKKEKITTQIHPDNHGSLFSLKPYDPNSTLPIINVIKDKKIYILGNYLNYDAIIGVPYIFSVELSKPYIRDQSGKSVTGGRIQLKRMQIDLHESGYLKISIIPEKRREQNYEFTTYKVGETFVGPPKPIGFTKKYIPLHTKAEITKITLSNDTPFPCTIIGIQFWLLLTKYEALRT